MSTPYAEADARANGVTIASSQTELQWLRDYNSSRGDDFALYPAWVFTALYNESKHGLLGYEVTIWADNGQIYW